MSGVKKLEVDLPHPPLVNKVCGISKKTLQGNLIKIFIRSEIKWYRLFIESNLDAILSVFFNSHFKNLEVDKCPWKEILLGQSALLKNAMYIIFPCGDISVNGMNLASGINFYNCVLMLNELITEVVFDE